MAEHENTTQRRPIAGGMRPGMPGVIEKPKNFRATTKKLIRYCRPFIAVIIVALVCSAAGAALRIIGPDRLKVLTDKIMEGLPTRTDDGFIAGVINMHAIWRIVTILGALYCTGLFLSILADLIMATITQKASKKMRSEISQKINRLPMSYFNQTSYGDVLSRVTNDVDTIGQTLNQTLSTLIMSIVTFFGCMGLMFYTNYIMAFVAIGASFIGFAFMAVIMKMSQKHFNAQQEQLGAINGHIEEKYTGHNVVSVYNGGRRSRAKFETINDKLYVSGWKSQFFSGLMMPLMAFIGNFGYVCVCVVGAVLTSKGIISFGVIVAFMIYVRLFTQPLAQFAQAGTNLQRTAAASERVFEFLESPEMPDESAKTARLENVRGALEFKHVKYKHSESFSIKDFNVSVKAGQKIAIVGPTGAGKTTIVNLVMRFYDALEGDITLDGTSIYSVPRENVHEQFCMVLQDTWVFEGTIKENIIYSKTGVTDEQVVAACQAVGLHHFIMTLPAGYDTVLNDKAALSEGEKQLLTIARAIVKNAPLLILDEATSSVDTRTERRVKAAMDKLMEGRTSFVIAHRLSTIKNADVILVMRDGDIVESGNHAELLKKGGYYAELYNSQFEHTN